MYSALVYINELKEFKYLLLHVLHDILILSFAVARLFCVIGDWPWGPSTLSRAMRERLLEYIFRLYHKNVRCEMYILQF